jgi:hypothetical protein
VVIAAVDQGDADLSGGQRTRRLQAAKAAADDNDMDHEKWLRRTGVIPGFNPVFQSNPRAMARHAWSPW